MFFSLFFFECLVFGLWFAVYCVDAVLLVKQRREMDGPRVWRDDELIE